MDLVDNSEELKSKIKALPPKDKVKAVALNFYLDKKKIDDEKMEAEIKLLSKKYDNLSSPLFDEILSLVRGTRAPNADELNSASKYLSTEEQEKLKTHTFEIKPIPQYWLKVLQNGDLEELQITTKDVEPLTSLESIECLHAVNKQDYTLRFTFSPNDFFTNPYLDKSFIHGDKEEIKKTEGSKIEWKDGKDLTRKIVKKKQKNKKSGAQRIVSKEVDAESFFRFFRSVDMTDIDKLDDETQTDMQEQMEVDEDLGSLIVDELIPYSIEYYLGIKQEVDDGAEKDTKAIKEDEDDFSDDDDAPKKKAVKGKKKK